MPKINKAPNAAELEALRKAFLKAETDIINEIARLRSLGNVDYHAVAALNRVQKILKSLEDECWKYVPKMVEKQFYVRVPEARRVLEPAEKHLRGYAAAEALTATQYDVVQQLVNNLMGEVVEAELHVMQSIRESVIGPPRNDVFRRVGLQAVANMEARGIGFRKAVPEMVRELQQNGVEAFVDKAGRKWSLHTYGNMVCRTTSRQAEIMAVLTADPDHDLYQISSHATTCPVCAPFEGRVYSRSGKDPDFPPLASAFGKIDPDGPDELTNTWLNIHPNCLVPGGTILAEGVVAHSCRDYSGSVISLKTSSGNEITVTPNHPILTTEGFVPAGKLKKSHKIIETTGEYRFLLGKAPNDINIPTRVEQVKHSIVEASGGTTARVKGASIQFHGDGIENSEVNIVFSNSLGKREGDIVGAQPIRKSFFPSTHFSWAELFPFSAAFQILIASLRSFYSIVRRIGFIGACEAVSVERKKAANISLRTSTPFCNLNKCKPLIMQIKKFLKFFFSFFYVCGRNVQKLLGRFFNQKPIINHCPLNHIFGYSKMFGNLFVSEPLVAKRLKALFCNNVLVISNLVQIDTSEYVGKVYNLQTKYGFYTYNNIVTHNCIHVLLPWTKNGKTPEELERIKRFSDPKTNPFTVDPRSQKQIEAYRRNQKARSRMLNDYRQWERYRLALGDKCPKTFQTFLKHKRAGDEKYRRWEQEYRKQMEAQRLEIP